MDPSRYHLPRHCAAFAALAAAAALTACNDPVGSDTPYVVVPVSTTVLAGTSGWTLTDTLVVEVRDAEGHPAPGAKVTWSLPEGGSLAVQLADADNPMTGTADDRGRNFAVWTLGLPEGTQVARAVSGLTGVPAEFEAEATVLHARAVSAGAGYGCAVLQDNRPYCWGENSNGQLGTGDTTARAIPSPVVGLAAAQEIRASLDQHTCARDLAGDVWCWGKNRYGEVGPSGAQPKQVTAVRVPGAEGAVSLSLSADYWQSHTCAVLGAGGARCWGYNLRGQLGTGDLISSASPRPVVGSEQFRQVFSGGDARSCALDADGEAWCWGNAGSGEFLPLPQGIITIPARPVPGRHYFMLGVGYWRSCGLEFGGGISCWGQDNPGVEFPWPVHLEANAAEVVGDGWDAVFARSRYGELFLYASYENYRDRVLAPIVRQPRFAEISGADGRFCGIAETGGIYCGDVGDYWSGYRTTVRGVPAVPSP